MGRGVDRSLWERLLPGCWLAAGPHGSWSIWRGKDPEMAAPGMISFLAFLSKAQTSGGPKWGRVARRETSGHWPCPSFCLNVSLSLPSPEVSGLTEFLALPISSAGRLTRFRGCRDPGPCHWTPPLTIEVFKVLLVA